MSRANESNEFSLPAIFLMYFTCTLIQFEIISWHSFYGQERWPYRLAIARLIVRTYVHALIVRVTKPRGWEWPVNVPSVTSSLRLHTQTEELGPDTLRCIFDRGEREGGGGFFAPWERVIVVSSRLLSSKHIGTIDNIARNSTGLCVGKNE